jgi:hypothetical protein
VRLASGATVVVSFTIGFGVCALAAGIRRLRNRRVAVEPA